MMFTIPWDEHKVACDEGEFEDVSLMMMCIVRNQWNSFTTPNATEPAPVGGHPRPARVCRIGERPLPPLFLQG
jgi:hypothetical protein